MTGNTSGIARPAGTNAPLWQIALRAFAAAAIANIAVYFIANAVLSEPLSVPAEMGVVNIVSITLSTLVGTIGAVIALVLIKRFMRHPGRTFQVVAVVALIVSLAGPFGVAGIALATRLVLALMHIIAATIIVGLLTPHTRD